MLYRPDGSGILAALCIALAARSTSTPAAGLSIRSEGFSMHEPLDSSSCHSPHRPGLVPGPASARGQRQLDQRIQGTSASSQRCTCRSRRPPYQRCDRRLYLYCIISEGTPNVQLDPSQRRLAECEIHQFFASTSDFHHFSPAPTPPPPSSFPASFQPHPFYLSRFFRDLLVRSSVLSELVRACAVIYLDLRWGVRWSCFPIRIRVCICLPAEMYVLHHPELRTIATDPESSAV